MCFEYSVTCTTGREFIDMVVRNPLKSKQNRQLFVLQTKATKSYITKEMETAQL